MSDYNPDEQRLMFDGLDNCRELGGMPLANNKVFRRNLFLRSDTLSDLTEVQTEALIEYGVRVVIDLRSEAEIMHRGNPMQNRDGISFYPCSLFVGDPESEVDETMVFLRTHHLGDFYCMLLERLPNNIINILRILKDSNSLCLFHCAHGKDRTGVITAILYLLAGASREDIIHNYEVSYLYKYQYLSALEREKPDNMKHTMRSDRINMVIFLDYIDQKYGGDIKVFLREAGMTDQEINDLRNKCIE